MNNNNYNKNNMQQLDDELTGSLMFKDHQPFFNQLFEYRGAYLTAYSKALHDRSNINLAFENLMNFVNCAISQILMVEDITELNKKKNKLLDHLSKKNYGALYGGMDELYIEVSKILQRLGILPDPKVDVETEETKFWRSEEHEGLKNIKKGFMDVLTIRH